MSPRSEHRFDMHVDESEGSVRLVVAGDFDRASMAELERKGRCRLESDGDLVVDLTSVTLIDSGALSSLVRLQHLSLEQGAHLEVVIGPSYQGQIFAAAGLSEHLNLVQQPPPPMP